MNTADILTLVDAEIASLQRARALIAAAAPASGKRKPGRPAKAPTAKPKRTISTTHRAAIAAAQKKRWAGQKAAE